MLEDSHPLPVVDDGNRKPGQVLLLEDYSLASEWLVPKSCFTTFVAVTWTPKSVKQWPLGLLLMVLGHYFTYFGGPGSINPWHASKPLHTDPWKHNMNSGSTACKAVKKK